MLLHTLHHSTSVHCGKALFHYFLSVILPGLTAQLSLRIRIEVESRERIKMHHFRQLDSRRNQEMILDQNEVYCKLELNPVENATKAMTKKVLN